VKKNLRGTRVFKTLVLPRVLLTQRSSSCRSEAQIIQSPTQRSIVQSKLQRSSFFLCSSFLFRFVLPLFFVRSFFLFFFRSVFNCPIGALTFFILRSSSVHCSFSDLFFLYSSSLFFIRLFFLFFFRSIVHQVPKSSLKDSVLLFRTQVYKTRDLSGFIFPTHQVGIKSLTASFRLKSSL